VHFHYIHRSSALPEGLLGGLPSVSLTTKGSWIHLGGGSHQTSRQPADTSTPDTTVKLSVTVTAVSVFQLFFCLSLCKGCDVLLNMGVAYQGWLRRKRAIHNLAEKLRFGSWAAGLLSCTFVLSSLFTCGLVHTVY